MRFANHEGRLTLISAGPDDELDGATGIDVHEASGGAIPADPELALQAWGGRADLGATRAPPLRRPCAGPAESGMEVPDVPLVFAELSTAVAGPFDAIALSTETVDWEVEIAVVELLPGDVIFTGTPSRIGMSRTPPRYLSPGDRPDSWIEGFTRYHIPSSPNNCVTELREGSP